MRRLQFYLYEKILIESFQFTFFTLLISFFTKMRYDYYKRGKLGKLDFRKIISVHSSVDVRISGSVHNCYGLVLKQSTLRYIIFLSVPEVEVQLLNILRSATFVGQNAVRENPVGTTFCGHIWWTFCYRSACENVVFKWLMIDSFAVKNRWTDCKILSNLQ